MNYHKTAIETNSSDRYLLCNYRFPDKAIKRVKADVENFMADREKDDIYFSFINWLKKKNEIVVLTMYAYDDIFLPKSYDTVFQINQPGNFVHVNCTVTQAVWNGYAAVNQISRGHKHICVIEFDKTIDDIFRLLTCFDLDSLTPANIQLGLCDKTDFEEIKLQRIGS